MTDIVLNQTNPGTIIIGYRPEARGNYSEVLVRPHQPSNYKSSEALQKWNSIELPAKLIRLAEKAAFSPIAGSLHAIYAVDPATQQIFAADSQDKCRGFWDWLRSLGYGGESFNHTNMPRIVAFDPRCLLGLLWRVATDFKIPGYFGDLFVEPNLFDPRWPLLFGGAVATDEVDELGLARLSGVDEIRIPAGFKLCRDTVLDSQILAGLLVKFKMMPPVGTVTVSRISKAGEKVRRSAPKSPGALDGTVRE